MGVIKKLPDGTFLIEPTFKNATSPGQTDNAEGKWLIATFADNLNGGSTGVLLPASETAGAQGIGASPGMAMNSNSAPVPGLIGTFGTAPSADNYGFNAGIGNSMPLQGTSKTDYIAQLINNKKNGVMPTFADPLDTFKADVGELYKTVRATFGELTRNEAMQIFNSLAESGRYADLPFVTNTQLSGMLGSSKAMPDEFVNKDAAAQFEALYGAFDNSILEAEKKRTVRPEKKYSSDKLMRDLWVELANVYNTEGEILVNDVRNLYNELAETGKYYQPYLTKNQLNEMGKPEDYANREREAFLVQFYNEFIAAANSKGAYRDPMQLSMKK